MEEPTRDALITMLAAERAALRYAVRVIESYQFDLRNSADVIGIDLTGFCQGELYRDALADIQKLRTPLIPDPLCLT